jgi:hypothetical protein
MRCNLLRWGENFKLILILKDIAYLSLNGSRRFERRLPKNTHYIFKIGIIFINLTDYFTYNESLIIYFAQS